MLTQSALKPVSLLALLCLPACGDDTVTRPGGMGGTMTTAGSGGESGMGGMPMGGGGTGGGNGGSGGGMSGPPPCTGCVEVSVPFTAAPQVAMIQFNFGNTLQDLSNATITWRMRTLQTSADLYVTPFAQNNIPDAYPGVYRPQVALTEENGFSATDDDAWVEVTLDLANTAPLAAAGDAGVDASITPPPVVEADAGDAGADAGDAGGGDGLLPNDGFDKSIVWQTGIQVGFAATYTGNETLRLLIDEVRFDGVDDAPPVNDRDFSDDQQGLQTNTFQLPPNTQIIAYPEP